MIRQLSNWLTGLILLTTCPDRPLAANDYSDFNQTIVFQEQQHTVYVAIATDENQRAQGLMFRKELAEDHGMLFVYQALARQGVWMKNTLIALDVLFLAEDGAVTDLLQDLPPCKIEPCRIYTSKTPAQYMLELPAGFVDKHAVKIGQRLLLP